MHSPIRFIPDIFIKNRPIHLTVFLTKRCNSNCNFCFYLKDKNRDKTIDKEITLEELRSVSASMGRLLWLAFSGGEIYLKKDLIEITEAFYNNNRPSIILLPTNGFMPEIIKEKTERILKSCPKSIVTVKVSLDGIGPTHDYIRGVRGGFDKVMKTCETLGELLDIYPNFELGINTLFCAKNQDDMDRIIDFVNNMKTIKTHTITMIRGDIEDSSLKEIDFNKYLRAIKRLEYNLKEKKSQIYRFKGAGVKAAQDIIQRRLIYKTKKESGRQIPCYAGRLNIVIEETGEVFPCELLHKGMGNLSDFDYRVDKLLEGKGAKNVIEFIEAGGCFCTHECYMMTNILFNPRMYGGLLKEYLRVR